MDTNFQWVQRRKNIKRNIFSNSETKLRMHIKSQQQERAQPKLSHDHKGNPKEPKGLHPIDEATTPTLQPEKGKQYKCQTWGLH